MGEILNVVMYSALGIILMQVGIWLVDLLIPCNFPEEIKRGNMAVGYISAGTSISVGILIKSAVMSKTIEEVSEGILVGVGSTIFYFGLGMVALLLGYLGLKAVNRKYNLNSEIGNGNPAAGLMVMGFFIGLAVALSGVLY